MTVVSARGVPQRWQRWLGGAEGSPPSLHCSCVFHWLWDSELQKLRPLLRASALGHAGSGLCGQVSWLQHGMSVTGPGLSGAQGLGGRERGPGDVRHRQSPEQKPWQHSKKVQTFLQLLSHAPKEVYTRFFGMVSSLWPTGYPNPFIHFHPAHSVKVLTNQHSL